MQTLKTYKKHLLLSGSSIKEALERLNLLAIDAIIFIVDKKDKLIGSLTDGDVRRGLLKGYTIEDQVDQIIQPHPRYIRKEDCDFSKVIDFRNNNFRIIPIVNQKDEVVNVINFREIRSYLPIDAVIMAGGRGERLRPLTDQTPKPLLMVGEKTIIDHNIDRLRLFGIDDIWITSRYLGEQIIERVGNGAPKNVRIHHVKEAEPLGTIGSVSLIHDFSRDFIMVLNSDLLTNVDYEKLFLHFIHKNADLAVVTIPYRIQVPYAIVETDDGAITDFKEKPQYTYYANGGIYLFKRELLKHIPIQKEFNSTDFMETLIKNGKKVISFPHSGYWLDIGTQENYKKAQEDIQLFQF